MDKLNIIDSLFDKNSDDDISPEEITIPKKCAVCKNTIICSVLPTLVALSRINIFVSIEKCPYFDKSTMNGK